MRNFQLVEIEGKRVLTTSQLAQSYGTTRQVISNNYTRNRERYIVGKHFIPLEGQPLKEFKASHQIDDNLKFAHVIYLWTEKGALFHAKSLNTDQAWEVYDYLVDFYFRAKDDQKKEEVVPVMMSTKPIPDELPEMKVATKESHDVISIFKILMQVAEMNGLQINTKELSVYKSYLHGKRIAIRNGLSLEEVNYEIAFELFHATVNCDKGDMLNTPLAKYYNSQAEKAATLIISLLNVQTAYH
ncbi:hypothetical protein C0033_08825 [Clostridium sp. chh4-2]|uniref:ORF6N domain-containing protein n=1 Tax=Clostridium sp. chh4-2 TaxID=2067550 RepID=UPI000CCEB560|nr:ORF6N domain-containing protein [Clostridium sp. chh4-2]PNV62208.1 hypothetical protein C0033_08825 [Clostridium sp. chh4-2]